MLKYKSCKEVAVLTSDAMDRSLTFNERIGMFLHHLFCESCVNYRKHLGFMRKAARALEKNEAGKLNACLRPESYARIRKNISREISV